MKTFFFIGLVSILFAARAESGDCFGMGGALFGRYQIEGSGVTRDGSITASAGMACKLLAGEAWGLDVGGITGAILTDHDHPLARPVLGAYIGADYSDAVSIGVVPHWESEMPFNQSSSWAVGIAITTRLGEIGDAIASWFSDGIQDGINP